MKKTLSYVWSQSEQCAINSFLKETMHELFKLCLLVILNGVSIYFYIYIFQWHWVGWGFPVVAAPTLLYYSVWVCVRLVIVLLFDCRRALHVDRPLLQQLGVSLRDYLSRWPIGLQPQAVTFDGQLLMSLSKPFKWKKTQRNSILFLFSLTLGSTSGSVKSEHLASQLKDDDQFKRSHFVERQSQKCCFTGVCKFWETIIVVRIPWLKPARIRSLNLSVVLL